MCCLTKVYQCKSDVIIVGATVKKSTKKPSNQFVYIANSYHADVVVF